MKDLDAELADLPLLKNRPDVTGLTNLGRSTIYAEVSRGQLRAIKIGRSIRIQRDDLLHWLEAHTESAEPLREGCASAPVKPERRLEGHR